MKTQTHTLARNAVVAAAILTLTACSKTPPSGAASQPPPVIVTTIHHAAHTEERVLTATVRARVETDLGFRVAGRIVQRLKDVGDLVKAGEPIARLDPSDYALGLEAARDQLRAATVDAGQAAADEARLRRLLTDGSVGTADHERQKARADATAARVDEALRHLEVARNRTGYATLMAPYTGVVIALRMEVGQVVGEGQPVASLAREGEREIVADVPEALIARVRQMRATATAWHGDDRPIELALREVSPMASSITGTFRVRYALAKDTRAWPLSLPLGATARLQLSGGGAPGAALPASALIKANGEVGVWIVDDRAGSLRFQPVHVQLFEADAVRVGGLHNGSRVVTVGAQKLDAAMKVTPIERRDDRLSSDVVGMEGGR
jgi:RND family efflux transporter MFP subunit